MYIVRDISFARGHKRLEHRMTSLADINNIVFSHNGPYVFLFPCQCCKTQQAIRLGQDSRVLLNSTHLLLNGSHYPAKFFLFNGKDPFFSPKNFFFIRFKLGSNISFGIHKGLFPDPLLRHFFLVCIPYFNIIAENIIVANF